MQILKSVLLIFVIMLTLQSAQCEEVFCVDLPGYEYIYSDDFDPNKTDEASCNMYAHFDFYKETYQRCLKQNAQLREAYKQGKCSPVTTKVHNFGSTECIIKLDLKHKKQLAKQCIGPESSIYQKKIDSMYSDFK